MGTTPQHLRIDSQHSADHSFYPMVLSVVCAWLRNDLRVHDSPATRECEMLDSLLPFHLFSGILQFGVMWIILKRIYPQIHFHMAWLHFQRSWQCQTGPRYWVVQHNCQKSKSCQSCLCHGQRKVVIPWSGRNLGSSNPSVVNQHSVKVGCSILGNARAMVLPVFCQSITYICSWNSKIGIVPSSVIQLVSNACSLHFWKDRPSDQGLLFWSETVPADEIWHIEDRGLPCSLFASVCASVEATAAIYWFLGVPF